MSKQFSLYPTLDDVMRQKIAFHATGYSFCYHNGAEKFPLETKPADETWSRPDYIQIADERGEWSPNEFDLCFERTMEIQNPMFLFGKGGLSASESEIGVALIWTSKTSNKRGSKVLGSFSKTSSPVLIKSRSFFEAGEIGSTATLQTVLYLKSPAQSNPCEGYFAKSQGTILGILDEYILLIDGKGSVFPIVEISDASQPLWKVDCMWSDPLTDSFDEENIRICLNTKHKSYKALFSEDGIKNSPLFMEVVASALHSMVVKVKDSEDWAEIIEGKGFDDGSIAEAVYYSVTTFDWDTSSPEKLAMSIRRDLDNRI